MPSSGGDALLRARAALLVLAEQQVAEQGVAAQQAARQAVQRAQMARQAEALARFAPSPP